VRSAGRQRRASAAPPARLIPPAVECTGKVKGPRTVRVIRFSRACTTFFCSLLRTCGPEKLLERPSSLKSVRAWHQGLETSFLFSSRGRPG